MLESTGMVDHTRAVFIYVCYEINSLWTSKHPPVIFAQKSPLQCQMPPHIKCVEVPTSTRYDVVVSNMFCSYISYRPGFDVDRPLVLRKIQMSHLLDNITNTISNTIYIFCFFPLGDGDASIFGIYDSKIFHICKRNFMW